MDKVQTVVVVAVAYLALGAFSAFFAYSDQDAWSVWLTSGLGLGLVLGRVRSDWMPVLAGAFLGALIFNPLVGSSLGESFGYALIEVLVTVVGGLVAARLSATPLRFESPRDVGAVIAGAFALALTGAVLVSLWDYFTARSDAWRTFRVWLVGNFAAILLLAPFIAAWAQLQLKRPDTRTLLSITGGVVACALFVLCVHALFGALAGRNPGWVTVGFTCLSVRPCGASDPSSAATNPSATLSSTHRATRLRCRWPGCCWRRSWNVGAWRGCNYQAEDSPRLTRANQLPRSAASFLKSGDPSNSLRATARRRSTVAASSVSAVGMVWKLLRSLSSAMPCSETSMK